MFVFLVSNCEGLLESVDLTTTEHLQQHWRWMHTALSRGDAVDDHTKIWEVLEAIYGTLSDQIRSHVQPACTCLHSGLSQQQGVTPQGNGIQQLYTVICQRTGQQTAGPAAPSAL